MSDAPDAARGLAAALADRYRIERELGGGGMARVFVAREVALDRDVVIKVIAPELREGLSAERFAREVRFAARLQQANIVPVLSAGDADGTPYYTMPFVRGESLRARLSRGGAIPLAQAVSILRDIARALEYAHGDGVVHRDIKPENILLSGSTAVVTDFGIARAIRTARVMGTGSASASGAFGTTHPEPATLTELGTSLGTPAYMAPEQAAGDAGTDHRADLYAWGMVAWEMLAGRHPFAERMTPRALLAAQMAEMPAPLATARPDGPPALAALVMRCLEKDPALRPQSAREVLAALDESPTPAGGAMGAATARRATARRWWAPAALALAMLAVLIGGATFLRDRAALARPSAAPSREGVGDSALTSLAVLPFVNTGGDARDEYFSDGMTDELAHALSKLPELRLAGRSSSFSFKGKSVPAPDVGRALGVGTIVEGTVRRSGDRLRVTAQLTSTRDGRVIWSDAFERAGTDVFAVQDAFTSAIVSALTPMLGGGPAVRAAPDPDTRGTKDALAYDLYLRGRYYWAQRGAGPLDTALTFFQDAVRRDPSFARGWAGLALTYAMRTNYNAEVDAIPAFDSAEVAARRALALDSTLADAYASIGMSRLRRLDLPAAARWFATARRIEPQNPNVHHWSGLYFWVIGDSVQADRELDIALRFDPLSATTVNSRAVMLSERRRFADARAVFRRVDKLSPIFFEVGGSWQREAIWNGRPDAAVLAQTRRQSTKARGRSGGLVFALAAAGRWDEARRLRDTIERPGNREVMLADRGLVALAFGEFARAADLLVASLEHEGAIANIFFSLCDPMLDRIRDQPVFIAFRQRHGLPACPYRSPWPITSSPTEAR